MKRVSAWLCFVLVLLACGIAWAGQYLDTAVLLVTGAHRTNEWVFQHMNDRNVARAAHTTSAARVQAAQNMLVPKEVSGAHPHLLLMLEASERACYHAKNGRRGRFLDYLRTARAEERTYRSLLKGKHYKLPKIP